jgi:PKD domain
MQSRHVVAWAVVALALLTSCGGDGSSPGNPAGPSAAAPGTNRPPTASIRVSSINTLVSVGKAQLSATASDPDGDSLTYEWDFGDGTTATGPNVSKTYDRAGGYHVVLTVRDSRGGSTSTSVDMHAKAIAGVWKDRDQQYGIQVQQAAAVVKGRTVFPVRDLTGALKGVVGADGRVTWRTDYFGGAIRDYFDGKLSADMDTLEGKLELSDGQITIPFHVKLVREP